MNKTLTQEMKKEIINKCIDLTGVAVNKIYANNTFSFSISDKEKIKDFEKNLFKNFPDAIKFYFHENKLNLNEYNRTITYSVNNKDNNIVINF